VIGIYRSLPTNRSSIDAIKSINTARFAKGASPKGFCPIDEQSKRLQVFYNTWRLLGRDNDVITEHEGSAGLMKPLALQ
jgi:hypothetical protein